MPLKIVSVGYIDRSVYMQDMQVENSSGRVGGGFRRNIAFAVEGIS